MKTRRFTSQELVSMSTDEYRTFCILMEARAYRMLGIPWKKTISWYRDIPTGDLVVEYE